jgi:Na+/melibiose symporter-like transporter
LPASAVLGFALGSLGSGVYSTVPTVLLLYYCTEVLGIAPAVAAVILLVPKAWAILWDPLVGAWSDRSRSASGRRAPFILAGALGVSVTFALLFNAPVAVQHATVAYVMVVYFLMASTYSLFAVPYVSIPAEISPVPAERERLMTWRMAVAMLGVLIGAGIAPHLVELAGGGRGGYGTMALVVAGACGLAMLATYVTVRRHHARDSTSGALALGLRAGIALIAADRGYLRLWLVYLLAMSGSALFVAMVPYFVTRVLGRAEGEAGTALFVMLVGTIASMPLWGRAPRHFDARRALAAAILAYGIVTACFLLLPHGTSFLAALLLFLVLGVPFAGLQLLPFMLLAHLAHDAGNRTARQEGLYTGIWTAGEKLALAIGPAAAGAGLALGGYIAGAPGQSERTLAWLQWVMAFGPLVFLLPSLLLLATRPATTAITEAA